MNDIDKIFIIGYDRNKLINISEELVKRNSEFNIASCFNTYKDFQEEEDKYLYYISEDQLNLDFKNNSLLYVITNSNTQESIGIALEEFYNSKIIPISLNGFNLVKNQFIENSLIVWIDSILNRTKENSIDYQINMIESNYLLSNINNFKDKFIYFSPKESINNISNIIMEFLNGDDKIREQIILENS